MEDHNEYFAYGGEAEAERDAPNQDGWGAYAWAPFLFESSPEEKEPVVHAVDLLMVNVYYYNETMHFEKEKCIGMGTWDKTDFWNAQSSEFDELKERWDAGMHTHLAQLRTTDDNYGGRGIVIKRKKMCERNIL
jgi:hypothetical protein